MIYLYLIFNPKSNLLMFGWNGILSFIIKNNPSLEFNKVNRIRNGEKNHYHQFQIKFLLTFYGYFFCT